MTGEIHPREYQRKLGMIATMPADQLEAYDAQMRADREPFPGEVAAITARRKQLGGR